MRMIGTLKTEEDAATFSNYLLTVGIDAHIEEGSAGWQVWVEHDDHVDRGRDELSVYQASPNDPRFKAAAGAARIRRDREKAAEKRRKNYTDVRTKWSGVARYGTPVALAMIAVSIALTLMTLLGGERGLNLQFTLLFDDPRTAFVLSPLNQWVITPGHTMFHSIAKGQVWRLVTPIFMHGGALHLLFNMVWMWQLGRVIESIKGSGYFLFLVLVTAIVSCCAEAGWAMISPFNSAHWTSFVGMSGVIGGLFGYAWMKGKYEPWDRMGVSNRDVGLMLGWFVICTIGLVGSIANMAHWFGLLSGMAIVLVPRFFRQRRKG